MNTSSPSAWQQITPQSTHGFRKDAWVIPYGPSVPLQGLLVLSRKFSAQPARFPPPPPLPCSSGDGYKHLLICLQAFTSSLLHGSQNLLFKMQIQSGYFLAKPLELLSTALGVQFRLDHPATHFCRLSAVGTKLVLMYVPLFSVLTQVHVSRVRAHTERLQPSGEQLPT